MTLFNRLIVICLSACLLYACVESLPKCQGMVLK